MNEYLGMLLDGGISEHWPDLVLAALFTFVVWLLQRWISAGDRRDEALSAESRKQGDKIVEHTVDLAKHDVRISVIESQEKTRQGDRN